MSSSKTVQNSNDVSLVKVVSQFSQPCTTQALLNAAGAGGIKDFLGQF